MCKVLRFKKNSTCYIFPLSPITVPLWIQPLKLLWIYKPDRKPEILPIGSKLYDRPHRFASTTVEQWDIYRSWRGNSVGLVSTNWWYNHIKYCRRTERERTAMDIKMEIEIWLNTGLVCWEKGRSRIWMSILLISHDQKIYWKKLECLRLSEINISKTSFKPMPSMHAIHEIWFLVIELVTKMFLLYFVGVHPINDPPSTHMEINVWKTKNNPFWVQQTN